MMPGKLRFGRGMPLDAVRAALAWAGLVALICFFWAHPAAAAAPLPAPFTGKVSWVYDGDSMVVMQGARKEQVRLKGIDAPERGQPFADRARSRMKAFEGAMVRVEPVERDPHQRLVSWVTPLNGGPSLNLLMCQEGLAWWYQRFAPLAWDLAQAMLDAARERKGLWSQPRPTPPWQWRSRSRSRARD